jgi:predicted Zn-dependent protease
MQRIVWTSALLLLTSPALAQDKVSFVNPTTRAIDQVEGTIQEESPAEIKIKLRAGGMLRTIPATAITEILYQTRVAALDFRQPFGKEVRAGQATRDGDRKRLLSEALKEFEELAPQVKGTPHAYRYIRFKIAQVTAELGKEDPARARAAVALLTAYKTDFPTGWEIVPALKLLARVQEEQGALEAAGKTYAELADLAGLPPSVKQESEMLLSRLLLRGGKPAEAAKRLQALLASLPTDDARGPLVRVLLAQSRLALGETRGVEDQLKTALANSSDPGLRAAAYNTLGDYYRLSKQDEEAFWHYLRVDVLYIQDKAEQAKALYYLAPLFERVKKDAARARECREKLKDRQFSGLEYQRRAEVEKKDEE